MRILRYAAAGTALLIAGCGDSGTILDPSTAPSTQRRSADAPRPAERVAASGEFVAVVDFSTLRLTPRGRNCMLQVKGQLNFTGTIAGVARGQTTALVSAPCGDVAAAPPGTFGDVFRSELTFSGTVAGRPARANMLYMGRVQPGGAIAGRLVLSNGVAGELAVKARVAVGGEYRGSVVMR